MQKITSTMLRELFTTRDNGDDTERIVYSDVYLRAPDNTTEYDLYELASDIAHGLGVTHGFSYEIMSRAVDVLAEAYENIDARVETIDDIDADNLAEDIDAIVPVYNHTLLLIANPGDYGHIDEAREVFSNDIDTIQACAAAWYSLIDVALRELHDAITSYNDND